MPSGYSATKIEDAYVDDFLVMELDSRYNRKTVTLTNNSGGEIAFKPGEMLEADSATAVSDADADNEAGVILCQEVTLADGASAEVSVLYQGPAIVNEDALTVSNGAATLATVLAFLKTQLTDVVFVKEPDVSQTGPLV